jgi:hypothetical protein
MPLPVNRHGFVKSPVSKLGFATTWVVVGSRTSGVVDVEVTSELVVWVIVDIDSEVVMVSVVTGAVDIVVD